MCNRNHENLSNACDDSLPWGPIALRGHFLTPKATTILLHLDYLLFGIHANRQQCTNHQ
jgi:hypothetical protein